MVDESGNKGGEQETLLRIFPDLRSINTPLEELRRKAPEDVVIFLKLKGWRRETIIQFVRQVCCGANQAQFERIVAQINTLFGYTEQRRTMGVILR